MDKVKIDGVLHNYECDRLQFRQRDPSLGVRIFTCPAGEPFQRRAQHDIPNTSGKFRTNGHTYEF